MRRSPRRSRRSTRALFAFEIAAVATWMCAPRAAWADGPRGDAVEPLLTRLELTYSAPPECASRAEVTRAIARRIEPGWLTRADSRRFAAVIVRADSTTYRGRLDVEHSGRAHSREVSGSTCAEVTAALAVFVAIALDPVTADDAEELQRSPPVASDEEPRSSAPGPPPEPGPPEKVPLPRSLPPRRPSGARRTTAPEGGARWTWSSAVSFTYLRVPEAAAGARVSAQLARDVTAGRLSPALRASWGFADFTTLPDRAGRVAFRLETAQVAACAVVDLAPMPLTLTPCAGADVGTLASTARDLPRGTHVEGRWFAAHAFVRAAWALLPWLTLELEAGALVPLERSLYALSQPPRVAYRAPSVLFSSSVGLGVQAQFP